MRTLLLVLLLTTALAALAWATSPEEINRRVMRPHPHHDRAPRLQLAILLDTSNSMDSLIHQARTQIWGIVNRLEHLRLDGSRPQLELALYEYGNNDLPEGEGYLRMVLPFTGDLDRVSEELFALRTNGGREYAPQVTQEALQQLLWSRHPRSYRAIVVAGNETFHQGPVRVAPVAALARDAGVFINTIYCGDAEQGVRLGWELAARLSGGAYRHISLRYEDHYLEAPQDARIRQLNQRLNATYLAYGEQGASAKRRQEAQDRAVAAASPEALVQRSRTKAGNSYSAGSWDLVDALQEKKVDLKELPQAALPEDLRGKPVEEVQAKVAAKARERAAIQQEIVELSRKREAWLAARQEEGAAHLQSSLAPVFLQQAQELGFVVVD